MAHQRHEWKIDLDYYQQRVASFGAVTERFLRWGFVGAELRLTVSISALTNTSIVFTFAGDAAGDEGTGAEKPTDTCLVTNTQGLKGVKAMKEMAYRVTEGKRSLTYEYSLRSWITGLKGLSNREELLRLLGREDHPPGNDSAPAVGSKALGPRTLRAALERTRVGYAIMLTIGKNPSSRTLWSFKILGY